jgi:hypothetical protein
MTLAEAAYSLQELDIILNKSLWAVGTTQQRNFYAYMLSLLNFGECLIETWFNFVFIWCRWTVQKIVYLTCVKKVHSSDLPKAVFLFHIGFLSLSIKIQGLHFLYTFEIWIHGFLLLGGIYNLSWYNVSDPTAESRSYQELIFVSTSWCQNVSLFFINNA